MTIGFDASRAQSDEPAGPENYTYNLLKNILRLGGGNFYHLYLRSPSSSFQLPFEPQASNFELRTIDLPKFWTQVGLSLECLRRPPDVLFIPAHTIPIIRRPSLKTVVTIHDVGLQPFLEQYQRWWWRLYGGRISNYAARNATHLIAVSRSTKRDLVEKLGVASEKISVVYEGVDHRKFRVQSSKFKIEETKGRYGIAGEYFLFVGTIQPRKNLVRLIEAFSKAAAKDFTLVLVGKKGWLADEIYAAPRRFAVEDRVKFLGYVPTDDVATLLSGAEAFLFPSLYEGFGLVVLEALACGCPVLTSNISSLPEVVGEAGVLVDPHSVKDIALGITELLGLSKEARNGLVQRGIEQAQKFSWEKAARETLKVLYDVARC
jgi:glycosyltransferase involved in cell wall biosynthesis